MDSIVNYSSEDDQESDKDIQIRANQHYQHHHRDKVNNIDGNEEQGSPVYQNKSESIRRHNKYSNDESNYEDIQMDLSEDSNLSFNDRNEEKKDHNSASSTTSKQRCNDNINKYSQKKDKRIEVKNSRLNYDGEDRYKSRDHSSKNYYRNREEKDNNNMNRRKYDRNRERGEQRDRDRDRDRDRNRDRDRGRDRDRDRDPDRNHDRDRDQRDRNRNHRGDHREHDRERNNKSYYKDDQVARRYRTHDRDGGGGNDDGGYHDNNDNSNRGGRGDDYRNRDERRNRDDFRDREKDNNHRSYNRDYKTNRSDRNFTNNETSASKDYRRQDSSPSAREDRTINEIRRDRKNLPSYSRQRSQERERDHRDRVFSSSIKSSFQSTHQNQDFEGSYKDQQKSSLLSSSSPLISINPFTTIGNTNTTTANNAPTLNSPTTIIENKSNTITVAVAAAAAAKIPSAAAPITLPSYYNPNVINPNKYAEQVQKRKLLWSNKKIDDTTNKWGKPTFAQDTDGKVASKFMRLMGIKSDSSQSGGYENSSSTAATITMDNSSNSNDDSVKKREEMFSSMEQQYEVARQATHTMRGVGLGFGSQPRQF